MNNYFINTQTYLYGQVNYPPVSPVDASLEGGYQNLPLEMIHAINRGEAYNLDVELYPSNCDDIFSRPDLALFRFSSKRHVWNNCKYRDAIKSIPSMKKFIGKTFNSFTMDLANVERNSYSGSSFVFKRLIRGFRVAVRVSFPELNDVKFSRLIWWGRVVNSEDITENSVRVQCSQEVGNFSYELVTEKYTSSCPIVYGGPECLGTETLAEKSALYRRALQVFGQGGCNRTLNRCKQFSYTDALGFLREQDRFYRGQNQVAISGQFDRVTTTTSSLGGWLGLLGFLFKRKKTTHTPVPYSSKNQEASNDTYKPIVYGRTRLELHAFTWMDVADRILALLGACMGPIDSFHSITSHNPKLTITSITQHLGEFGGQGTQQPDGRFPQSGYNSKLAYIGADYSGSTDAEIEDVPITSAVIKGLTIPVLNSFGAFETKWSNNPVDIVRHAMTNFPYTVIRPAWFNEQINKRTYDRCFTVVEDDTNAEIPIITGAEYTAYQNGEFARFRSTSRFDSNTLKLNRGEFETQSLSRRNDYSSLVTPENIEPYQDIYSYPPDVMWGSNNMGAVLQQARTYLMYRYTTNVALTDTTKLSDALFSLLLPSFRGFLNFDLFGTIGIDCRRPADNTFIRGETPVTATEVPVTAVTNFFETYGWLMIGNGLKTCEIAKVEGVRYVNGFANTVVSATSTGGIDVIAPTAFIPRNAGPAEFTIEIQGACIGGDKITLKLTDPDGSFLEWDYVCEATDSLEIVAEMFRIRLLASAAFREHFTAEIFSLNRAKIYVRCQTGYLKLDRELKYSHSIGEEILRVVEVYEDGRDEVHSDGLRDNIKDFSLNGKRTDTYHAVEATYISAVRDFVQVKIQPRVAWDAAENERNLNILELDLRAVDNYRQAAFLQKTAAIVNIDGNLPAKLTTGLRGMFHEFGEAIAVRHQVMHTGDISYTAFTVEDFDFDPSSDSVKLDLKLYLSAEFDERVAQEEKFLETTLAINENHNTIPPPITTDGGYSTTRTGDGGGDIQNNIRYETQKSEVFPDQQVYSPHGRDKL